MSEPHKYEQKDVGYPRTKTDAMLRVTFEEDGSVWDVPLQIVADSRDEHYGEKSYTIGLIRADRLDKYTLTEWAINQMDWDEFEPYAVRVEMPPKKVNYIAAWMSADRKIVGKI